MLKRLTHNRLDLAAGAGAVPDKSRHRPAPVEAHRAAADRRRQGEAFDRQHLSPLGEAASPRHAKMEASTHIGKIVLVV